MRQWLRVKPSSERTKGVFDFHSFSPCPCESTCRTGYTYREGLPVVSGFDNLDVATEVL